MFHGNTYPVVIQKATPKDTEDGRKISLTLALLVPFGHFNSLADDLGKAVAVFDMNDDPLRGLDNLKYISPLGTYSIVFSEKATSFDDPKFTLGIVSVNLGKEITVLRLADDDGVRFVAKIKCEIDRTKTTAQYFLHDHHGHKVYCRMYLVEAPRESGHLPQGKLDLEAVEEFSNNIKSIKNGIRSAILSSGDKSVTILTDEYADKLLCIGVLKAMHEAMPTFTFNDTDALMAYLTEMNDSPKEQLSHIRKQVKGLESRDIDLGEYTISFGSQSVHVVENGTGQAVHTLAWQPLFEALTNRHISIGELANVG